MAAIRITELETECDILTEYDELVKNLRICSRCDFGQDCNGCTQKSDDAFCCDKLLHEAADAIEELSEYANYIGRLKCEGWYLQQTKYRDGYHAVATMPLPEPPKEE